ncbi:hypothetical protein [Anaerosacchariphilus polymeriproducens]|uniref:Uncharacterized protein n=1 Tax=Anaerosacchariphilus polymeriproducens TaxID=1812858 RepID=A0A371AZB4_9FIRM|nr:hypothetical protein [Anaerosacchariphilus polymeriproducens]RDU24901.1 hypothetical protein DWV06_01330 [Anaerosacchariphilus polymeriproducens]
MKKTIRKNIINIPYSLHDSHIKKIKIQKIDDEDFVNIKILFKEGFYVPKDNDTIQIKGKLLFKQVDLDCSFVYIMGIKGLNCGKIAGRKYSLKSFVEKYEKVDMEIIDATYGYNMSNFSGYMYFKHKIKEFTIELYHFGDMIFLTEI